MDAGRRARVAAPGGASHGREGRQADRRGCARRGIEVLTLFAFSSENWQRPREEVSMLMGRFVEALDTEVESFTRTTSACDSSAGWNSFPPDCATGCRAAEALTAANTRMTLVIAVAYGGRWDIAAAARELARRCVAGKKQPDEIDESAMASHIALAGMPDPDLFIRTGGEQRISNFLLWNLAYTELYFCDTLWPDFGERGTDGSAGLLRGSSAAIRTGAGTGRDQLMLRQRIITALLLAPAALLVILWIPHQWTMAILALMVLAGAWEWAAFPGLSSPLARAFYVALVGLGIAVTVDHWRRSAAARPCARCGNHVVGDRAAVDRVLADTCEPCGCDAGRIPGPGARLAGAGPAA